MGRTEGEQGRDEVNPEGAGLPELLGQEPTWETVRKDKNGAIYLNIRGLYPKCNRTKMCYLRDLAVQSNSSMIVMTETHLTSSILDAEIHIPGYVIYRADRDESRTHGGCAVYVREDLTCTLEASHSNSVCETLAVKIKTLNTLVVVQYRPPDCQLEEYLEE